MAVMRHVDRTGIDSDDDSIQVFQKGEPDSRIEDLMGRIKAIEVDRVKKYERKGRQMGESDYEVWRRLNIGEDDLSSSDESDSDDDPELAAARRRKKKKKKHGADYLLNFDDLDAYNRALAVHEDAYSHRWVQVMVEKGEGEDDDEGANLEDSEMNPDGTRRAPMDDEEEYAIGPDGIEVDMYGRPRWIMNEDGIMVDKYGRPRPDYGRQDTEFVGDVGDGDPQGMLRSIPREDTEYLGDMGEEVDPQGMLRPMVPRQKTERDMGDVDPQARLHPPSASAEPPVDRRQGLTKQATEYIGSISDLIPQDKQMQRSSGMSRGMGSSAMERTKGGGKKGSLGIIDDDDEDNEDQAEGQEVEVVDRRAGLSKQDTEHIGSISDLIPQDRPMERSSAMRGGMGSSGMQRSNVGGGKKGSLGLGAINDDDEEDSDQMQKTKLKQFCK